MYSGASPNLVECSEIRRKQRLRCRVVQEAMDVVVQITGHVIVREWRCDDSVHNDELFLSDDGIQSFGQGGGHHGDPLLASNCHHTVVHRHQKGVLKRQR